MATTRADYNTSTLKKEEYFSDFFNSFDTHPISHSLIKTTNENSVRQSVKNLILTNLGERLFQPYIGSDIYKTLFEPNDVITAQNISFFVKRTLSYNEPRINVIQVDVIPRPDSYSFNVNIIFSIINNPTQQSVNIILKRVR